MLAIRGEVQYLGNQKYLKSNHESTVVQPLWHFVCWPFVVVGLMSSQPFVVGLLSVGLLSIRPYARLPLDVMQTDIVIPVGAMDRMDRVLHCNAIIAETLLVCLQSLLTNRAALHCTHSRCRFQMKETAMAVMAIVYVICDAQQKPSDWPVHSSILSPHDLCSLSLRRRTIFNHSHCRGFGGRWPSHSQ